MKSPQQKRLDRARDRLRAAAIAYVCAQDAWNAAPTQPHRDDLDEAEAQLQRAARELTTAELDVAVFRSRLDPTGG